MYRPEKPAPTTTASQAAARSISGRQRGGEHVGEEVLVGRRRATEPDPRRDRQVNADDPVVGVHPDVAAAQAAMLERARRVERWRVRSAGLAAGPPAETP